MLESSYELAGIAVWVGDGIRWNPRFLSGYESFGAELCQSSSSVVEHHDMVVEEENVVYSFAPNNASSLFDHPTSWIYRSGSRLAR